MITRIKICGIKTLAEAMIAVEAGADYLGFNFHPQSARYIEVDQCAGITSILKKEAPSVGLVGVFVNAARGAILDILQACSLDLAQLHGDESAEFCNGLGNMAFKALRGVSTEQAQAYRRSEAPAFLLDADVKGAYGGTGITGDWSASAELAKHYSFLLAGGLRPENVAEAIRRVHPWGVDVASGVESRPGEKDPIKVKSFVRTVRSMETGT